MLVPVTLLPAEQDDDRYGVAALTEAWLASYTSPHTRRAYRRDLTAYLAWCLRQRLHPLKARMVDASRYLGALADQAPTTVNRAASAVSSWYRFLMNNEIETGNPFISVRRPRVDYDASTTAGLSVREVIAIRQVVDELAANTAGWARFRRYTALRNRALVRLLACSGMRVGEVIALEVTAIGANQGYRTVQYLAKGDKRRERSVAALFLAAFDEFLEVRGTDPGPLFAAQVPGGGYGPLDPEYVRRMVRHVARLAKVPHADRISPHSFRHAFATNGLEMGIALDLIQRAMGHADPRTTMRYNQAREQLHREPGLRLGEVYSD